VDLCRVGIVLDSGTANEEVLDVSAQPCDWGSHSELACRVSSELNVELSLPTEANEHVVKNLWPLYVHDISAYDPTLPNPHGILGLDRDVKTLNAQGETQATWFRNPKALFPYLILVDGVPSGFNFIATGAYLPKGVELDFVIHEFFLLHQHRGTGAAERAATAGFDRHPGRWEIVTYPSNGLAISFWRRVVDRYTGGSFSQSEGKHFWGTRVIWRFDNS